MPANLLSPDGLQHPELEFQAMDGRTLGALALVAALVTGVGHALSLYDGLPESVASSFSGSGQARGWLDREIFLSIYLVTLGFTAAVFLAVGLLLGRIPDSLINMPHKEYWLAAERRTRTIGLMQTYCMWYGTATIAFLIGVMHRVMRANTAERGELGPGFVILLAGYLLFTGAWVASMLRRLRKPRGA